MGRGFGYALRGWRILLATQVNARIHLAITLGVAAAGFFFRISAGEWCALVLAAMVVWAAEALNTALEFVVDLVSPEFHPLAGKAKDVAAGAVLAAAVGAAVVGLLVFGPHLVHWLTS